MSCCIASAATRLASLTKFHVHTLVDRNDDGLGHRLRDALRVFIEQADEIGVLVMVRGIV